MNLQHKTHLQSVHARTKRARAYECFVCAATYSLSTKIMQFASKFTFIIAKSY